MTTNGTKSRRSQKDVAVERLIAEIQQQIARHRIAIEELEVLSARMRIDQQFVLLPSTEEQEADDQQL
jgi:hypothetical protein